MALMKIVKEFVDDLNFYPDLWIKLKNYFTSIEHIGMTEQPYPVHIYRVSHPSLEPGDYFVDIYFKKNMNGSTVIEGLKRVEEKI